MFFLQIEKKKQSRKITSKKSLSLGFEDCCAMKKTTMTLSFMYSTSTSPCFLSKVQKHVNSVVICTVNEVSMGTDLYIQLHRMALALAWECPWLVLVTFIHINACGGKDVH